MYVCGHVCVKFVILRRKVTPLQLDLPLGLKGILIKKISYIDVLPITSFLCSIILLLITPCSKKMFVKLRAVQIREKVMTPLLRVHQQTNSNLKVSGCLSIWSGQAQHTVKLKAVDAHTVVLSSNLNPKSIITKVLQYEVTESLGQGGGRRRLDEAL